MDSLVGRLPALPLILAGPILRRVTASSVTVWVVLKEVPREGVHVTVRRRLARWIDGSTHVWTAYRRSVGRGEGSSELRFDRAIEPTSGS